MLEIHNERVRDLLYDVGSDAKDKFHDDEGFVDIRQGGSDGVHVPGA